MAILDLQGLQAPSMQGVRYGNSGASKGCTINTGSGGKSALSLALC